MMRLYFSSRLVGIVMVSMTCVLLPCRQGLTDERAATSDRSTSTRPNIIVILADDQGYGDLGCFGADDLNTPNLDGLAASGMRFTDFHVQSAVCSPSRAALLTGVYPKRAGVTRVLVPKHGGGLRKDTPTIAELLKPLGYATACIGKWHLGHRPGHFPTERGFDEYFGIPYSNDMGRMRGTGVIDDDRDVPSLPLMRHSQTVETEPDQTFLTKRYTEEALTFIDKNSDRSFFLYFPHTFPHRPWFASEAFRGQSRRGLYGDMIEEIDWSVGEIVRRLKDLNLINNTLIVFTSDNGPAKKRDEENAAGSAGSLRGHKFSIYEGGHRVPCIMSWPETITAGSVCSELTTAMDLMPTFAGIVNTDSPPSDGHDIRSLMTAEKDARSPYDYLIHFKGPRLGAIRHERWKLIGKHSKKIKELELYDLQLDIGEKKNVAQEHPQLVKELLSRGQAIYDSVQPR